MRPVRLGNFYWPANPETYTLRLANNLVEHKYPDSSYRSIELSHRGDRDFSLEGEFFGPKAYDLARRLLAECGKGIVLDFEHPLYPNCKAAAASLELVGEPRENYVKYSLTIKRHFPVGKKEAKYVPEPGVKPSKTQPDEGYATFTAKQGDTLHTMAARIFGSGAMSINLALLNRGALGSLSKLAPGQVFRVPVSELEP